MNSSFLYHVWGLYNHKCSREEYKGNTIILHVETKGRVNRVNAFKFPANRVGTCCPIRP